MTRDEIITLASDLGQNIENPDTLDTFMNDVFNELAMIADPQIIRPAIVALTSGTATYAFESDMLKLVYAFMFDELLSPSTHDGLNAYSQTWPTESGTPIAVIQDEINARNYTLYPNPDFTSDPLIPIHGEPYGEDLPNDSLILIYADNREDNISDIFSLPTSFDALQREFSYPSDHADFEFAEVCGELARILYTLIGVV